MNINSTLIIQMLHFGLAYGVLRKFLFRPTVDALHKEVDQRHILQKSLEEHMHTVSIKKENMQEDWRVFYTQIDALKPMQVPSKYFGTVPLPSLTYPTFSQQEVDILEQEVAHTCAQKVSHVR